MAELRQQTASEEMSLEDLFLKLTGGPPARSRSTPCSTRDRAAGTGPAQPLDRPHAQVARRARPRPAGSTRARGPSSSSWPDGRSASGARSSASPTGCSATSGTCQDIGNSARRQGARRDPAGLSLDPAALQPHHRALDVLPRQGPRPAGRGADRLAPALPRQAGRDRRALVLDGGAAGAADPHRLRYRVLRRTAVSVRRPGGDRSRI